MCPRSEMETAGESEIQQFYNHKTVFITGGTGFLGKVLIEKLLRTTEVKRILLLIRPKKNKSITERLEDIFNVPLFDKLHELKPEFTQRVTIVLGDCLQPQLGLSSEDRETLIRHVEVVVHSAATVRFNEPLSDAIAINLRATIDLLRLAQKMTQLQAFVHVSSAFANCHQLHLDERLYTEKIGFNSDQICQSADVLGKNLMNTLAKEFFKNFPNTYCFTKALAEEAVLRYGANLPVCIFRPGIVIPTWRDPLSGWIDNFYGPISIIFSACYGVMRVMNLNLVNNAGIVPVDCCANLMLSCGWDLAKQRAHADRTGQNSPHSAELTVNPPPVYNLLPDDRNPVTWALFKFAVEKYGSKMPLSKMIWYPFLIACSSKTVFKFLWFIYHTLPGFLTDVCLLLTGKKRRMLKTYRKIYKYLTMLEFFSTRKWTFAMDNTRQLWKRLSPADQQIYNFDMCAIDWLDYLYNSICGMRLYLGKEGTETIPKSVKKFKILYYIHRGTQALICAATMTLLYSCYSAFLK